MLRRLPVLLAALLIAAHFLRAGELGLVLLCLLAPALLWVRRAWAARLLQGLLLLASLEWVRTLLMNVEQRQAAGAPWLRMALILGAVALFTALAALAVRSAGSRAGDDEGPQDEAPQRDHG